MFRGVGPGEEGEKRPAWTPGPEPVTVCFEDTASNKPFLLHWATAICAGPPSCPNATIVLVCLLILHTGLLVTFVHFQKLNQPL